MKLRDKFAILFFLLALLGWTLAIWTGDDRWIGQGFMFAFLGVGCGIKSFFDYI